MQTDLPFLGTPHVLAFDAALREYEAARLFTPDRRWRALLYLCTVTPLVWDAVRPHLDFEADHADLEAVTGLTRGEALLLRAAGNLFREEGSVDLAELADGLDDEVWDVLVAALHEYRQG